MNELLMIEHFYLDLDLDWLRHWHCLLHDICQICCDDYPYKLPDTIKIDWLEELLSEIRETKKKIANCKPDENSFYLEGRDPAPTESDKFFKFIFEELWSLPNITLLKRLESLTLDDFHINSPIKTPDTIEEKLEKLLFKIHQMMEKIPTCDPHENSVNPKEQDPPPNLIAKNVICEKSFFLAHIGSIVYLILKYDDNFFQQKGKDLDPTTYNWFMWYEIHSSCDENSFNPKEQDPPPNLIAENEICEKPLLLLPMHKISTIFFTLDLGFPFIGRLLAPDPTSDDRLTKFSFEERRAVPKIDLIIPEVITWDSLFFPFIGRLLAPDPTSDNRLTKFSFEERKAVPKIDLIIPEVITWDNENSFNPKEQDPSPNLIAENVICEKSFFLTDIQILNSLIMKESYFYPGLCFPFMGRLLAPDPTSDDRLTKFSFEERKPVPKIDLIIPEVITWDNENTFNPKEQDPPPNLIAENVICEKSFFLEDIIESLDSLIVEDDDNFFHQKGKDPDPTTYKSFTIHMWCKIQSCDENSFNPKEQDPPPNLIAENVICEKPLLLLPMHKKIPCTLDLCFPFMGRPLAPDPTSDDRLTKFSFEERNPVPKIDLIIPEVITWDNENSFNPKEQDPPPNLIAENVICEKTFFQAYFESLDSLIVEYLYDPFIGILLVLDLTNYDRLTKFYFEERKAVPKIGLIIPEVITWDNENSFNPKEQDPPPNLIAENVICEKSFFLEDIIESLDSLIVEYTFVYFENTQRNPDPTIARKMEEPSLQLKQFIQVAHQTSFSTVYSILSGKTKEVNNLELIKKGASWSKTIIEFLYLSLFLLGSLRDFFTGKAKEVSKSKLLTQPRASWSKMCIAYLCLLPVSLCDDHMLSYHHTGLYYPEEGRYHFETVGYVDDQEIDMYSSKSHLNIPKTAWMEKNEDDNYWKEQTSLRSGWEKVFKENLMILASRFNYTRSSHTLQLSYGCTLHDSFTGYYRYGFDGKDFLIFDQNTLLWIPGMQKAEISAQRWNSDSDIGIGVKFYLNEHCKNALMKYIGYGREELEKRVRPEVKVWGHRQSDDVTSLQCLVYGFHPRPVDVKWVRNGEDHLPSDEMTPILPHPDGTYQIRVSVEVQTKEADTYSCHVDHSSLEEVLIKKWEPDHDKNLFIIIITIPIVLAGLALSIIVRKKKIQENCKKKRNGFAASKPHRSLVSTMMSTL